MDSLQKAVGMRQRDIDVLEFDKLKDVLAGYTVSSAGKALVEAMAPSSERRWVERGLRACAEMMEVQESPRPFPLQGLRSIDIPLSRLEKGGVLEPEELNDVLNHLRIARRVRSYLDKIDASTDFPEIASLASPLANLPNAEQRIERSISPEGEVLDDASPELRRIRHALQRTRIRIQERLQSFLTDGRYGDAIQDRVVTIRNGRYVIPVKQDSRGQIRGIVQGVSASGLTAFVEPMVVVELNNTLNGLLAEEEREIARILAELSDLLREGIDVLETNARVLAELDFLRAKAIFAIDYRCRVPRIVDEPTIDLREARHPLLEYHFRREARENPDAPAKRVVPTTIHVGGKTQGLVITGPNTGGKTVALKTVGLLALMAQCGMPIPAEPGSALGLFDAVFADIGDEQSIEQNLSTFSSHMTRVIRFLKEATDRTLVLLDEVGAGTDPTEGAALAASLLDAFLDKGALLLVTTHHGALKVYAHDHPRLENAAMEFDEASLAPTYRLRVGVPGSSHALRISERLGMPASVLEAARNRIGEKAVEMERLLTDVDRLRRELEAEREALDAALARAREREEEYARRLEELKQHRAEIKRKAEHEAETVLREARALIERTVAELRRTHASKEAIAQAHRDLEAARRSLKAQQALPDWDEGDVPSFAPGDRVFVRSMKAVGDVLDPPDSRGNVRVRVGAMTLTVPAREVDLRADEEVGSHLPRQFRPIASEKLASIRPEIDVRGLRPSEALDRVDKYLDDAVLAGLDRVWIIHGKGTGALRKALHEHFRGHPHVAAFRLGTLEEGDAGVTVADLSG